MKLDDYRINNEININEALEEAENLKYKNSYFFMSIYNKIYEKENLELTEDLILKKSINNYKEAIIKIIKQKETKEPFYKINNINDIINVVKNQKNNINKEITFIEKEFSNLGKENYIKNDLLNDLINFSNNYEVFK